MPTILPRRRPVAYPVVHLVAIPLVLLLLSALVDSNNLWPTSVLHALMRSGEIIANAEMGPGRIWPERASAAPAQHALR